MGRHRTSSALPVPHRLLGVVISVVLSVHMLVSIASCDEFHLNCGSGEYTSANGTIFEADRVYTLGDGGYLDGWNYETWQIVGGTSEQELYAWVRWLLTEYRFDLANGHYLVKLYLNEIFKHSTDENQFDVIIEGHEVLSDLDVYERVRGPYAIDFLLPVEVVDGQLNVEFSADHGYAVISAISVWAREPDLLPPSIPQSFEGLDSYGSIVLRWAPGDEDDLAGYIVEKAPTPGGPFVPLAVPADDIERVPWRIDAVATGETCFYRVRAIDTYGNESAPSLVVGGSSLPHAASLLPQTNIQITPGNLEILNDSPSSEESVPCSIIFDGSTVVYDALCRYRGNVTRNLFKKSWKAKLLAGNYTSRDNFNLNAEYLDKSLLRERVSYEILRRSGSHAPTTRFVHHSVNDVWMGVHLDVENINRDFLRRVGLEDDPASASVYKADSAASLAILPTIQDYKIRYEKELGDPDDYTDLIEFIQDLNQTPAELKFNWLARTVDLNRLLDFYSTEVTLQNGDITYKNYFLHHDLDRDIWTVLPWDVDLTFGNTWPFDTTFVTTRPVNIGSSNRLFGQIYLIPALRQLHFDRMRQLLTTSFEAEMMEGLIDSAYAAIAYDGERDWWKWGWASSEEFHAGPDELKLFVAERTAYLEARIAFLEEPEDMVINEIMASNNSTQVDEHGEYDDWVELYNRGSEPVVLQGLYLTDDLAQPNKLALPDTTLAPGERLLVWCDAQPYQGPLHAPFRLDVDGEAVGLFRGPLISDEPVDVRVFDAQYSDASLGRLPDGSPYWQILPTGTPGTPNVGGGNIRPQIRDVQQFPPTPSTGQPVVVTARIFDDTAISAAEIHYDVGGGYVTEPMADDGLSGDGEAGDGIYGAQIPAQQLPITVHYYLSATDDQAATSTEPPDAPLTTFFYTTGYEAPGLYLNEFMASNATTHPDEHGEYDDWVEIYNDTSYEIDMSGMFLTDDFTEPTKWMFPGATTIAPGGFMVIWCDDTPSQGPLHTTFKLNSTYGEEIGLFDSIAAGIGLIDTTRFGPQLPDVSTGRYPDAGTWQVLPTATPGASNVQVSVGDGPFAPTALRLLGPFPNPFNPRTRFDVELPASEHVRLQIIDVQGRWVRLLADRRLPAGRHEVAWDGRDHLGRPMPSGVYWICLETTGDRRTARTVLLR